MTETPNLLKVIENQIIEDPEIMGGELCLKGTRVPVYMVSELRNRGIPVKCMLDSYPSLTEELIKYAETYAALHPRLGQQMDPIWRNKPPCGRRSVSKRRSTNKEDRSSRDHA